MYYLHVSEQSTGCLELARGLGTGTLEEWKIRRMGVPTHQSSRSTSLQRQRQATLRFRIFSCNMAPKPPKFRKLLPSAMCPLRRLRKWWSSNHITLPSLLRWSNMSPKQQMLHTRHLLPCLSMMFQHRLWNTRHTRHLLPWVRHFSTDYDVPGTRGTCSRG